MSDEPSAILLHALEQLLADRDGGRLRDLGAYQASFPGLEDELAEHYAVLTTAWNDEADTGLGRIGRYRLLEEIGRGGQGVVHRARDDELGRTVALKSITGLGALDEGALRRFLREAVATSRLDHPGICPVYEHGQDDGLPYIAMGFVEGRSLARILAEDAAPPSTREEIDAMLDLFERAARALHAAHAAGVVHRDVKPGNLMIRPDGRPVLLDFGVARLEDDGATLTRTGHVLGTPAYMSPEQVLGDGARIDGRTDVYSLGVSLFEALTHRRPFDAPTRESLYRQILSDLPPDLRSLNPRLPADVRSIVDTALQKNPDERYASAGAFADDLARARRGEPIAARPPGPLRRIAKWAARNPGWVASLAVISMLLAAGTALTTNYALEAERALTEVERLADRARLDMLFDQADKELWPAGPELVDEYQDWFERMNELLEREDELIAARDAVRALALPQSDADRAEDGEHYALEASNLYDLVRQRRRAAGDPGLLAELDEYEAKIIERISQRVTFRFDDPVEDLRYEVLYDVCRRLHNVQAPRGAYHVTLEDMRARYELSRQLGERLVGEDAPAWRSCLDEVVRDDSVYGGLRLEPTAGLVPLGVDRDSGLWEFWHVASGARPTWEGEPAGRGQVRLHETSGDEGLVLVLIPGGTFEMGAEAPGVLAQILGGKPSPNVDPDAKENEGPVHPVTLAAFFMSKYEVTRAQWSRLNREDPVAGTRDAVEALGILGRGPVTQVDWFACRETARRWGLQLPTEAQWEYACRAGMNTPWSTGASPESLRGYGNVADATTYQRFGLDLATSTLDDFDLLAPVGALLPNPWGLHDMHGKASEWCRDGYSRYGEFEPAAGDGLRCPPPGWSLNVVRPGSAGLPAMWARSSTRDRAVPARKMADTGFRLARLAPLRD